MGKVDTQQTPSELELHCVQPAWESVSPEAEDIHRFDNAASGLPQSFFFLREATDIDEGLRKGCAERTELSSKDAQQAQQAQTFRLLNVNGIRGHCRRCRRHLVSRPKRKRRILRVTTKH